MAFTFKLGGVWYVRYKDEAGHWQKKSCGKDAKKSEAEYLANEYTAKEMNRRHKAPVRMVEVTLADALTSFRDTIIPRSAKGIDKQASSIRREKASVDNIISFVKENSLLSFKTFDKEMAQKFMDHRAREGMSPKTRREERRLLRKFFKWAIKQHYCIENATEEIIAPKLPKKKMRYFSEPAFSRMEGAALCRGRPGNRFLPRRPERVFHRRGTDLRFFRECQRPRNRSRHRLRWRRGNGTGTGTYTNGSAIFARPSECRFSER